MVFCLRNSWYVWNRVRLLLFLFLAAICFCFLGFLGNVLLIFYMIPSAPNFCCYVWRSLGMGCVLVDGLVFSFCMGKAGGVLHFPWVLVKGKSCMVSCYFLWVAQQDTLVLYDFNFDLWGFAHRNLWSLKAWVYFLFSSKWSNMKIEGFKSGLDGGTFIPLHCFPLHSKVFFGKYLWYFVV